jgi:predicted small lipoprotein YifL
MRAPTCRELRGAALAALLALGASGCGQQGPLVLRENARPVEQLEPAPAEPEPESQDDEQE